MRRPLSCRWSNGATTAGSVAALAPWTARSPGTAVQGRSAHWPTWSVAGPATATAGLVTAGLVTAGLVTAGLVTGRLR